MIMEEALTQLSDTIILFKHSIENTAQALTLLIKSFPNFSPTKKELLQMSADNGWSYFKGQ